MTFTAGRIRMLPTMSGIGTVTRAAMREIPLAKSWNACSTACWASTGDTSRLTSASLRMRTCPTSAPGRHDDLGLAGRRRDANLVRARDPQLHHPAPAVAQLLADHALV